MINCKICQKESKSNLVSHIVRIHKITIAEYKEQFPESVVLIIGDAQKDKIRKSVIRVNTPEHRAKLSKIQKNTSLLRVPYWIAKGYSEEDAKLEISKIQKYRNSKKIYDPKEHVTNLKYWIAKGYSEEDAREEVRKLQAVRSAKSSKFSGKTHTKKSKEQISNSLRQHIEEVGTSAWHSHFGQMTGPSFRSTGEIEIFEFIASLGVNPAANISILGYNVDILVDKQIIEYFGDYWHASDVMYIDESVIHPTINISIGDIRKRDARKIKKLEDAGYLVQIIWEHDWLANKEIIKQQLRDIFNAKNSNN